MNRDKNENVRPHGSHMSPKKCYSQTTSSGITAYDRSSNVNVPRHAEAKPQLISPSSELIRRVSPRPIICAPVVDVDDDDEVCNIGHARISGNHCGLLPAHGDMLMTQYVSLTEDMFHSMEQARNVLQNGGELERLTLLFHIPWFLQNCPDACRDILVPELCLRAAEWTEKSAMAAAEALHSVVKTCELKDHAAQIMSCSIMIINARHDKNILKAWGELLSATVEHASEEDITIRIHPFSMKNAFSTSAERRRIGAMLLGSIAPARRPRELESEILEILIQLCGDNDSSVRAKATQSISRISASLNLRLLERVVWPKLCEMVESDCASAKASATRAIAKSAEQHREDSQMCPWFERMLLPMFLEQCRKASKNLSADTANLADDSVVFLDTFAEMYGYFIHALCPVFQNTETWDIVLKTYRDMASCGIRSVRKWCAFNLPAVSHICGTKRPECLKDLVLALSEDEELGVRRKVAEGIHEVAMALASGEMRREVLWAFSVLLKDRNISVLEKCIAQFSTIINVFTNHTNASSTVFASTHPSEAILIPALFESLQRSTSLPWRSQELLVIQLNRCARKIPQELLTGRVVPLLFRLARESTFLVRKKAITALVIMLRFVKNVEKRDHIVMHFRTQWAMGKVWWSRIAYIDGSQVAFHVFSHGLFVRLFLCALLDLARDPVPIVRIRTARLLSEIASPFRILPEFQDAVSSLLSDEEEQVQQEATDLGEAIQEELTDPGAIDLSGARKERHEKRFYSYPTNRRKTANLSQQCSKKSAGQFEHKSALRRAASAVDVFGLSLQVRENARGKGPSDLRNLSENAEVLGHEIEGIPTRGGCENHGECLHSPVLTSETSEVKAVTDRQDSESDAHEAKKKGTSFIRCFG